MKRIFQYSVILAALIPISWICLTIGPDIVLSSLVKYHTQYPQEKFFVQTDKPFYVFGETLWFKVYGVLATTHIPITPSGVVYVQLLDSEGEVITQRNIKIENGGGDGDIFLDPAFSYCTDFTLRAFSSFNLNFDHDLVFQKSFKIYEAFGDSINMDTLSKLSNLSDPLRPKVGFYPEGGDLVAGIKSRVAVKASDDLGGIAVRGRVFDQNNNLITNFVTNALGLGSFSIKPQFEAGYHVEIKYKAQTYTYDLPNILATGHALSIDHLNSDTLAIIVKSNLEVGTKDVFLIGHTRGMAFLTLNFDTIGEKAVLLPLHHVPEGIAHFTLFSQSDEIRPVAERLVYINSGVNHQSTQTLQPALAYDKGTIEIEVSLQDSQMLFGSLSVFSSMTERPQSMIDICTYLHLLSDLTGNVENPTYYFQDGKVIHPKELDLLMLTHGWRRFLWKDLLYDWVPKIDFKPENGFSIKGKATRVKTNQGVQSQAFLSFMDEVFSTMSTTTDDDGHFEFHDIQIQDTTKLLLYAHRYTKKSKKKTKPSEIVLQAMVHPAGTNFLQESLLDSDILPGYFSSVQRRPEIRKSYEDIWSIDLPEVQVQSTRLDPVIEAHASEMLYNEPDSRVMVENNSMLLSRGNVSSAYDLLKGVPGVEVLGSPLDRYAVIRGFSSIKGSPKAMLVLNGSVVDPDLLNYVNANDIAFIDVIRSSAKATIYGSSTGVIAVYTKSPASNIRESDTTDHIIHLTHPGYYAARSFYQDHHQLSSSSALHHQYYSTVCWKPNLVFTKDTSSFKVSLPTSTLAGNYQIFFQGITSDGQPVYKRLSVDP